MVMKFSGGRRRLKVFQTRESSEGDLEAKAMERTVHKVLGTRVEFDEDAVPDQAILC